MDSIVDSFFPYLEIIEKDVLDIERLVFASGQGTSEHVQPPSKIEHQTSSDSSTAFAHEKAVGLLSEKGSFVDLARASTKSIVPKPHFTTPTDVPLLVRRARRIVAEKFASIPRFKSVDPDSPTHYNQSSTTILRMARIRRLVTSLARFLTVKSEVVAQVKKRLLAKGEWSLGTGTEDDVDIFVYMGDVQGNRLFCSLSIEDNIIYNLSQTIF